MKRVAATVLRPWVKGRARKPRPNFPARHRRLALTLIVLVSSGFVTLLAPPTATAAVTLDGQTSASAAPSCWWVKQIAPSSPDGLYWLQTPTSIAPEQFFCDMTTEGGGWVLIGRGREGWSFSPTGQRSAQDVRNTPGGTAAFPPAALGGSVVDGLLDGTSVSDLPDGILLRRASNSAGTSWQSVFWKTRWINRWNWSMAAGNLLNSTTVNGTTYTGGNTKDSIVNFAGQVGAGTGSGNNNALRVFTHPWSAHNFKAGFSYGNGVNGTSAATNFLWQNGNEGAAVPFTQVLIRPQLSPLDYPTVADTGTAATTLPPVMGTTTQPLNDWGVTGVLETGDSEPAVDTPVQAITQVGETIYVGGKFSQVRHGSGGPTYDQSYLAAFDRATGTWIDTFRPELDGTVWDLAGTSDGKLIVAGQFTQINGAADTAGLAALDPGTGAVISTWKAGLAGGGPPSGRPFARTLSVQGPWVYVGGLFTRVQNLDGLASVGQLARVRVSDGDTDPVFRPVASGQVYDLDATADRVYAVGKFETMNGEAVNNVAVMTPDGALVPGLQAWQPSSGTDYQQTIQQVGDEVYQGGSEHNLHIYAASDYSLLKRWVTADSGGDYQALAAVDGFVYGSTHAARFAYTDGQAWPALTGFTVGDRILYINAVDTTTHEYVPEFVPNIGSANTEGVWELYVDSAKCLWFGGDMNSGSNGQWLGGFGKFCELDHAAPTTPGAPTASPVAGNGGIRLTWTGSTDASGTVKYEVLRNDRVIAGGLGALNYTDAGGTTADKYFVRAGDPRGNRSASTSAIAISDSTRPTVPAGLAVTVTGTSADLSWNASTDNVGVTGYDIYRNGTLVTTVTTTSATVGNLPAGSHSFQVTAKDAAGNVSAKTPPVVVTVTGPDTTKPSVPTGLASTSTGLTITLNWNASTDNVGVADYQVFRNSVLADTVTAPTATVTVAAAGTYYLQVAARDAAGNVSARTAPLAVTVS